MVFGMYRSKSAQGIASVDLATGRYARVMSFSLESSGLGWIVSELPWIVWEWGDSTTNPSAWTLHAINLQTNEHLILATSRLSDGSHVYGQPPIPVIRHGVAAWAQPIPAEFPSTRGQIHRFDLTAHQDVTLDTGRVSSPVFAGHFLIWGQIVGDGMPSFKAVDADSLQPVELPERLRGQHSIVYLAGTPTYLAWNTTSNGELWLWRVDSQDYSSYSGFDLQHQLQFLQLAAHYVLWYGGSSSSVLDLETGNGFDVRGSVAGSDSILVRSEPVRPPATKTDIVPYQVSSFKLGPPNGLTSCNKQS